MTKTLSEAEAALQLEQLEEEYGLWSLRVKDFSPWRIVRFAVGLDLQCLPFSSNSLPRSALAKACLRSLVDIAFMRRNHRYVVKSFASALRSRGAVGYEDVYFESLLQNVPGGLRLHSLNAIGYEGRALSWSGPNVDTTLILVVGAVFGRIFPVRDSKQIFKHIEQAINTCIPGNRFPARRVRRMFSSFWWQSVLYRWLLRYSGVKAVFVADSGERAMLKAARETECRFVELQHGIFTPNHPDALPLALGLDVEDSGLLLPNIVAAYGSHWVAAHRDRLLGGCGRIRPVGASFIEQLRLKRHRSKPSDEVVKILVTTQGLAREELIALLREFLNSCHAPLKLDIKLHPAYDTSPNRYVEVLGSDSRVTVIPGSAEPDTHSLLASCSLHVSISSACHYDALGLRVPTVVLALPNHEIVLDLVKTGQAQLVRSAGQLSEIVAARAWISVPAESADGYYKTGFADNLLEWIPKS